VTLLEFPSTGLSWSVEVLSPGIIARQQDTFERSGPLVPGAGEVYVPPPTRSNKYSWSASIEAECVLIEYSSC
jgi:hypothetical protein